MIVIGRRTKEQFRDYDPIYYKQVVSQQFRDIEFATYDDLLDKAKQAYTRLNSLIGPSQIDKLNI
jgi:hypothetical protein